MKRFIQLRFVFCKLLAVAAVSALLPRAEATLLFEDGFNYNTGALGTSDVSPAGFSGNAWSSGSSRITVVSGNLTYPGLLDLGGNSVQDVWGTSAGSVVNTYTDQNSGTTTSIYYSFLLDATTLPNGTNYLTALNPGTGAPNGSSDALQIDVALNSPGSYVLGLRTPGKSVTLDTATLLSANTTYLVVAEYTFGTVGVSSASLYLDPTPAGTQPAADLTLAGNGTVADIDDVGFKAQGTSTSGTFLMDNLLIGTTWADVTPGAVAAPEPSSCTLLLAGAAVAMLGWTRFRRSF